MPNSSPLEKLNAYIKEHKLRRTYERERVLEYIHGVDGHFTVQSVFEAMNAEKPITLMTIYNVLELFVKIGIVVRHPFVGSEVQYETTARAATHHHRVCISCGAVKEFTDQKFSRAIKNRTFTTFEKRFHSIYLYGVCKKCQPKSTRKKK